MRLYHGSTIGGLNTLEPRLADHGRPYIYLSTSDVVASFYIVNAVERPYYWFPYGFSREKIPIYHELYPDAMREVSEGKQGFLYEVETEESQLKPLLKIPGAWLGTIPLQVVRCIEITEAYEWFLRLEKEKRLIIWRFEKWQPDQLVWWYNATLEYLREKNMIHNSECSYALFVQKKLPQVWEKYVQSCSVNTEKLPDE